MKERIKTAVEYLKDGQSFKIGDLRLGVEGKYNIYVTGWSRCYNIESLTKQVALQELKEIKKIFYEMVNTSVELEEFIKDKTIEYNLAFEYGQGAIGVCSEKDDVLKWHIEI